MHAITSMNWWWVYTHKITTTQWRGEVLWELADDLMVYLDFNLIPGMVSAGLNGTGLLTIWFGDFCSNPVRSPYTPYTWSCLAHFQLAGMHAPTVVIHAWIPTQEYWSHKKLVMDTLDGDVIGSLCRYLPLCVVWCPCCYVHTYTNTGKPIHTCQAWLVEGRGLAAQL